MSIFAVAGRESGNQRMADAGKEPRTFAAIICGVFVKNRRHSVSRRRGHQLDPEGACRPLAEGIHPTAPLRRRVGCLLRSTGNKGLTDCVRTESIKCEESQ